MQTVNGRVDLDNGTWTWRESSLQDRAGAALVNETARKLPGVSRRLRPVVQVCCVTVLQLAKSSWVMGHNDVQAQPWSRYLPGVCKLMLLLLST